MTSRRPDRAFWIEKYRSGQTPWDLGRSSVPVGTLIEKHFPPRGRVLVPGCGRGYEAIDLAQRGYDVTAIDFVQEPLDDLRHRMERRGVSLQLIHADMFELPAKLNGSFDVILEQTCLNALEPRLHPGYEALACRLLRPGGRLLGVFMEVPGENGPPYHCPPALVMALFPAARWIAEGPDPVEPPNPVRPGPEYLARFTRKSG